MIKILMLGNLGADSTLKHFADDRSVVNFSVAHTENRKNKDGVKESITIWADAAWWWKTEIATKVAPYLKKGKKVFIEGEPGARAYVPNGGGDPRSTLTIKVFSLEFAEAAQATTAEGSGAAAPPAAAPDQSAPGPGAGAGAAPEEDDLPF